MAGTSGARLTDLGHPAVMLASGGDGEEQPAGAGRDPRRHRQGLLRPRRSGSRRVPSAAALRTRADRAPSSSTRRTASASGATTSGPTTCGSRRLIAEARPPAGDGVHRDGDAEGRGGDRSRGWRCARRPASAPASTGRNLSFDVLPFDGQGLLRCPQRRATLVARRLRSRQPPGRRLYCGTRKSHRGGHRPCLVAAGVTGRRVPRGDVRRRPARSRQDRPSCGARAEVVRRRPTRSGWASTKADVRSVWPLGAAGGRSRPNYQEGRAAVAAMARLARAVLLASRSDLGRARPLHPGGRGSASSRSAR